MKILELADWELPKSQSAHKIGEAHPIPRLPFKGESRLVWVRFAPDGCGQFLMFLRRENDEREGNWTVRDRQRFEPRSFKAPYSLIKDMGHAISRELGRVFHFENFEARFGDERLRGVWRAFLSENGQGCWQNLNAKTENRQWADEPQHIFYLSENPKIWKDLTARDWLETLQIDLKNPQSDARFALNFAILSRVERENARISLERGTAAELRRILMALVQNHAPFWEDGKAKMWVFCPPWDEWYFSSGFDGTGEEMWEELNVPPILKKWHQFVFGIVGARLDESKIALHPCLGDDASQILSFFELRVEPPTFHEQLEARQILKDWFQTYAPDEIDKFI